MENRNVVLSLAAMGGVLLLAIALFLGLRPSPEPEPELDIPRVTAVPTVIEAEPLPEQPAVDTVPDEVAPDVVQLPAPPEIVAPPLALNDSDTAVRSAAATLASRLSSWLTPAEQIRKWVVFVDVAADGELMSNHRPWDLPMGAFKVYGEEENMRLSQENFERFDTLVATVESIPVETVAYYFQRWEPLFNSAYKELGKAGNFKQRLLLAMDHILIAEPLDRLPTLTQTSVMYTFADQRLESASELQKLLWRMGPENAAKIQRYVVGLRQALMEDRQYASPQ